MSATSRPTERAAKQMRLADTYVFTSEKQVANIVLPEGNRILLLVRGKSPRLAPIEEAGEYEVDVTLLANGSFPAAIVIVDLAHVPAWQRMSSGGVDDLLDQCARVESRQS